MHEHFDSGIESLQQLLLYILGIPTDGKIAILLFGLTIWITVTLTKSALRRWAMRHEPENTFVVPERVYAHDHEIRLTKDKIAELDREEGEQVIVTGSQGRKRLRIVSRNPSNAFGDENVDLSKASLSKLARKGSSGDSVHLEIKNVIGLPLDSLLNHPNHTTRLGYRLSLFLFIVEVLIEFRTELFGVFL